MSKHEAIIKQDTYRRTYYVGFSGGVFYHYHEAKPNEEYVETDIIWSGELDSPVLEVGDELYISELDSLVVIQKIIRTTLNEYIYFTKTTIEDELTKESLLKAEKELAEIRAEREVAVEEEELKEWTDGKFNWFKKLFK